MTTAFITHADCLKHDMGAHHPERPARLTAIEDQLIASGVGQHLTRFDAPLATDEQLARVHPPEYVQAIRDAAPRSGTVHLDPDTAMNPHTLNAALRAAGAAVLGVDLVLSKKFSSSFSAVRPPGHHACRARPMGFCIFNNVAVAARHAQEAHGLERVAVIDFDVHHGNGTEDIFEGDDSVLMASIFQHPFYPYSGTDSPASNMVNVPLPAGVLVGDSLELAGDPAVVRVGEAQHRHLVLGVGIEAGRKDDQLRLVLVQGGNPILAHRVPEFLRP